LISSVFHANARLLPSDILRIVLHLHETITRAKSHSMFYKVATVET